MEKQTKDQLIKDLLTRGVANVIPNKQKLEKLLSSGKKLNVYLGIDPTTTKMHLGHAFPLRKLQTLSDLGHNVSFLIGDFTTLIGDTSDKDKERPSLTQKQINQNFKTYKKQAKKILDFSKIKVVHNGDWLAKLTFTDIVKLCQHFSVGDFTSRELIRKRLNSGSRVALHEMLYPVMQGYDMHYLKADIQVGGTDQTFNMQAGRTLRKDLENQESFILATSFLTGTDGRKMSKTWRNGIWLTDNPNTMFGKVMSIKDNLIIEYFTLATQTSLEEIKTIKDNLKSGKLEPMPAKKQLALTITTELHSIKEAKKAQKEFESVIQGRGVPKNIPSVVIKQKTKLGKILLDQQLVSSSTNFKRLIKQGAIKIDNQKIKDIGVIISPHQEHIVKVGKLRFIKIKSA